VAGACSLSWATECPIAKFSRMGKVDWFAVALVVFGMLPVMVVAIALFSF